MLSNLLQQCDDILVALRYPELHGHLKQCPHHQNVGIVGQSQGHSKVLADLLDTLMKKLLIGNKLEEGGEREREREIERERESTVHVHVCMRVNTCST